MTLIFFLVPFAVLLFALLVSHFRSSILQVPASDLLEEKMSNYGGSRAVTYYVNWAIYGRKFRPQDLPFDKLTHILYAFANVRPDSGEVHLTDSWADTDIHWQDSGDSWNDVGKNMYGCLRQLNLLKRRNRHLKLLLSIGGWTYSSNFPGPASAEHSRRHFASTAVQLLKDHGFDGLDIDWEYPKSPTEGHHFVLLLQACREALDTYAGTVPGRPHFELTVACPAGPQNIQNMDLGHMDRYLDFWNLMAYDFAGSWDSCTGHQANLFKSRSNPSSTPFSTEEAVSHYLGAGIHPSKIVVGMPLYGRSFENTTGLGKPYSGIGQGSWEQGVYDYKALPLPGAEEHVDREAGASFSLNKNKGHFVTYDTVEMARHKAEWVKEKGLGGAMWWESSSDKEGRDSLVENVVEVLGRLEGSSNCLEYPESKWDNVRNGFC